MTTSDETASGNPTEELSVPVNFNEMVNQASKAINDAYAAGYTRQIVRVLLPRDPANAQLGQFYEDDVEIDSANVVLVPPDETWQGGIMQLYRSAEPTCRDILRRCSRNTGGIPPKITEDRSIDESGVDGVGLLITENQSPADDISCFVQPTQETVPTIESISRQAGKRLVTIVNPQWRDVDDALDSYSKQEGLFGSIAAFMGGKGGSLKRLNESGFKYVFVVEGYVCKGGNIKLLKRFDSDWAVFAEKDDESGYISVGTSERRPTYQDCDKMMDKMGISLKYARDIGLAPKL